MTSVRSFRTGQSRDRRGFSSPSSPGGRVALSISLPRKMAEQLAVEAARRGISIDLYVTMRLSHVLTRPDPLVRPRGPRVR